MIFQFCRLRGRDYGRSLYISRARMTRKTADETVLLVDACPNDDRLLTVIIFMKREMLLTLSLYLLPWRNFFNRQIKN